MAKKQVFSMALAWALVFQVGNAQAAPTEAQKCEGRKHVAAGKYAVCRETAQKALVLNANQTKYGTALGKCEEKFSKAWIQAEEKAALAGAACPDEPLALASVAGAVAQLTGNLAGALGGASLLSCTVSSRVLATVQVGCLPKDTFSGNMGPCPGSPLGQDGELAHGLAHSYTENGDGTITDIQTGLMWEVLSSDGTIHDETNTYTWYDAFGVKVTGLNAASFAGHNDWRLPNVNELESLREAHVTGLNTIFSNECSPGCALPTCSCPGGNGSWSSTSYPFSSGYAWYAYFGTGFSNSIHKSTTLGARAVRGGGGPAQVLRTGATLCDSGSGSLGACPGSPAGQDAALGLGAPRSFTDNLDGTITDNSTGLMWESLSDDGSIHDVDPTYLWANAFNKIAILNVTPFAGHNDWRLPNVNEMRSLINFRYFSPGFDPVFNAGCTAGCSQLTCSCAGSTFWTSTAEPDNAWTVSAYGLAYPYGPTGLQFSVRAVRDAF